MNDELGLVLCTTHNRLLNLTPLPVPDLEPDPWYVYFLLNRANDQIKIGKSTIPAKRIRDISVQAGIEFEILGIIPFSIMTESNAHFKARNLRILGEWFEASPELLRWIERLTAYHTP